MRRILRDVWPGLATSLVFVGLLVAGGIREYREFERERAYLQESCTYIGSRYERGWQGGRVYIWQCDELVYETPRDYR